MLIEPYLSEGMAPEEHSFEASASSYAAGSNRSSSPPRHDLKTPSSSRYLKWRHGSAPRRRQNRLVWRPGHRKRIKWRKCVSKLLNGPKILTDSKCRALGVAAECCRPQPAPSVGACWKRNKGCCPVMPGRKISVRGPSPRRRHSTRHEAMALACRRRIFLGVSLVCARHEIAPLSVTVSIFAACRRDASNLFTSSSGRLAVTRHKMVA